MNSITLKFKSIDELARFTKQVSNGYLLNTAKRTISGKFTAEEVNWACEHLQAESDSSILPENLSKKIDWL